MASDDEGTMPNIREDAAAMSAAERGPASYTLLNFRNSPIPFKLTWAKEAIYPLKIGIRKELHIAGLLKFTAKADYSLLHQRPIYGFSLKDNIFNGRFSANLAAKLVEYKKKFSLPNGSVIAVGAGTQYVGGGPGTSFGQRFRPILGAQLQFGSVGNGNLVMSGNGFSAKQRVPVPLSLLGLKYPRLDLETYTTCKIPQLTTRYSVQNDGFGLPFGVAPGHESDALHFHVGGINAVFRL